MFTRNNIMIGAGALVFSALLLVLFGMRPLDAAGPICDGGQCYYIHTTANDFVRGQFYATGLRKLGDGEVQLLPVGLTAPWQATTALPDDRAELALVSNNNILYAIGGFDGSVYHTEIYSATTSVVGSITAGWALADNLPLARAGAAAVVAKVPDPVLYVIGGGTVAGSDTIYYKKIGSNGSLSGSWGTATLPEDLIYSAAVVRNNNIYVYGGNSNATDSVYRIPILNSNGDLGTPVSDLTLPKPLTMASAVTWEGLTQGFTYVLGGLDNAQVSSADVFYSHFNADGTINSDGPTAGWNDTSLVDAFNAHGTIQYNAAIYVVGGRQGIASSDTVTKVLTALIDPDGSLHDWGGGIGHWIVTEPLPKPRFLHGTTVNDGGEIFMAGGYNNSYVPTNNVYHGSTTGAGSTYAPNGTYTSEAFDIGVGNKMKSLAWNATVENTSQLGLTMYYRTSNSLVSIQSADWTLAGVSAQSASGITNTLTFPAPIANRYLQYKAEFTTSVSTKSPRLNAVQLDLVVVATPTPTATQTSVPPTATNTVPAPSATATPTDDPGTGTPTVTLTPTQTATATRTATVPSPTVPNPTVTSTPCVGKPDKTILVSPSNKAAIQVRKVPLGWATMPCATHYKVVLKEGSKTGPRAGKKKVTTPQFITKALDKNKTYVWKVRACNLKKCGKASVWWQFKIGKNATLDLPTN